MTKSKIELALQELNEEIHMIVKSDVENDTSYFPDAGKVLETFENYLISSGIQKNFNSFSPYVKDEIFVFQENIFLRILLKYPRFINLLSEWKVIFRDSFKQIFSSRNYFKERKYYLPQVNMTEVIFLIYLCLEVKRKEIICKLKQEGQRNFYLLKQIIKILDQCYSNEKKKSYKSGQVIEQNFNFSINQDKFVKILLLKALKIKLQKQNFSFCQRGQQKNKYKKEKISDSSEKNVDDISKSLNINTIDENFSIISIQSQYNPSIVLDKKNERMKQSMTMVESKLNENEYELEIKNLSSQEIFNYIQLNELRGYITE